MGRDFTPRTWMAAVLKDRRIPDGTIRVASALAMVATAREFRPVVLGTLATRAGGEKKGTANALRRLRLLGYVEIGRGAFSTNVKLTMGMPE